MKTLRMLTVSCALVVLSLAVVPVGRAGAEAGMRAYHDPGGWFSIALPADWTPAADPARSLGAAFIRGFERSESGGWVRSTLAADGPIAVNGHPLPFIGVLALELPRTLSARAFGEMLKSYAPAGCAKTRDGDTRIAGREASYQYMACGELYTVMVSIPTPRATYLLMAGTVNQPERVNTDFGTIAQILESLHQR